MAQPNIADLTDEKPLEGVSARAQDSPTPQSVGTKDAGTEAPRTTTQRVFISLAKPRNRARNQAFAARLRDAMNRGGLHSSEVARRVWGTTQDKRGHTVARSRDRIGHYLNGVSYPSPEIMARLAAAVGLSVEELAGEPASTEPGRPGARPQGSSAKHTAVRTTETNSLTMLRANRYLLRLEQELDLERAFKILAILDKANAAADAADDDPQPGDLLQGGLTS
jgi:transcriptional regulator with XRE-family HTH domain